VATAANVYREIGELVRARGAAAWERRAVVPRWRKAWHAGAGLLRAVRAVTLGRVRGAAPREPSLWTTTDLQADEN
jgi:phytoene synthase